jgi:tetratricopeptide (TPR) repeat protein
MHTAHSSHRASALGLALALVGLLTGTSAFAQERWSSNKGDCEEVFAAWNTQSLKRLRDCTMRWEMYRDVTKVDDDARSIAQSAFEKLYQEGSERDAVMALSALKRLGLRPTKLREKTVAVPTEAPAADAAPVIEAERAPRPQAAAARGGVLPAPEVEAPPPEPTRAPSRRGSQEAVAQGQRLFKSGQIADALTQYLIAVDEDPTYAPPLYLTAMAYARLGKGEMAIDYLQQLRGLNSDQARPLMRRAAKDPEFKSLRGSSAFKELTGTAVIQLLAAGGDALKEKVAGYAARLNEIGMPVADVGIDRNPRHNTYVYAKPGFEDQGEDIRRQVKLGPVHKRPIHWPSEYDIIVVVGETSQEKFVDDEAEKNGQKKADMKKKEDDAKRKQKDKELAEREKMKQRLMMMQAMEDMEQPQAPTAPEDASQIPTDAPEAPALPE